MEFYGLCRQTRDMYCSEPNREIELQILSQLHSAVFANGDKLPDTVMLELNIKPLLKNSAKIKYWKKIKGGQKFQNARFGILCFFWEIVIFEMLTLVLGDLRIPNWDFKHFRQRSAWNFSIQISFQKSAVKRDMEDGKITGEHADYLNDIL